MVPQDVPNLNNTVKGTCKCKVSHMVAIRKDAALKCLKTVVEEQNTQFMTSNGAASAPTSLDTSV